MASPTSGTPILLQANEMPSTDATAALADSAAMAAHPQLGSTALTALLLTLVLLAAASLAATLVAFYLYRWRRLFLSNGDARLLSPEALLDEARVLRAEVRSLQQHSQHTRAHSEHVYQQLAQGLNTLGTGISQMTDTYMALQPKLDEKDKELARLRDGYDTTIIRRFVLRFARLDRHMRERLDAGDPPADLNTQVLHMLDDALAECGVERFCPDVGSDYRTATGVADRPATLPTADETQHFTIAAVQRHGYQFDHGGRLAVILPCEVVVYTQAPSPPQE